MAKKRPKDETSADTTTAETVQHGSWTSVVAVNFLMILVGVFIATIWPLNSGLPTGTGLSADQTAGQVLGSKGALLFKSLDVNKDGNISFSEFGPIVEKLTGEVNTLQ